MSWIGQVDKFFFAFLWFFPHEQILSYILSRNKEQLLLKYTLLCHSCLKNISTRPLRHMWPKVVMENHTSTPAAHGKSHILSSQLEKIPHVETFRWWKVHLPERPQRQTVHVPKCSHDETSVPKCSMPKWSRGDSWKPLLQTDTNSAVKAKGNHCWI